MTKLKQRGAYTLNELIIIISNAIINNNGIDNSLDYCDMDYFCIYTKGYTEYASAELVCYIEDYPEISDEDEEIFPDFVVEEGLKHFYSDEQFEAVIDNILDQKRNASMDEFVAALNYYRDHDDFLDL